MALIAAALRLGLGVVFVVAGGSKLRRLRSVRHVIAQYRLLPAAWIAPSARGIAVGEIGVGLLLMLSFTPRLVLPAIVAAAVLLCLFSVAVISALLRGIVVPCGCSLVLNGHVVTWATVLRNQGLLALLLLEPGLRR